jgi:iron(III) transport system ATP-binding protein
MTVAAAPDRMKLVPLRLNGVEQAEAEPVVRVDQVSHRFGKTRVLDRVSLELRPGRVHCLLGDSGCGKTTLLRIIAGLERPRGGTVTIAGSTVDSPAEAVHVTPERRPVGLVFQDSALFPHLDVRRNVTFGMRGSRRDNKREADRLISRVGMTGREKAMPHTLSGGQQQRVALARALGRRPKVMLLDEPFSGLDLSLRDRLRDETLTLLKDEGVAVLLVTHDPREALVSADSVSVMRDGHLDLTGHPSDVCVCHQDRFGGTIVRLCTDGDHCDIKGA